MVKKLVGRFYSWDEARDVMRNRNWKTTCRKTFTFKKNNPVDMYEVYTSKRKNYPPRISKRQVRKNMNEEQMRKELINIRNRIDEILKYVEDKKIIRYGRQ